MKKWLLLIVLASILALAACGGGSDEGKKSDKDSGGSVDTAKAEEIFKQNCASCHANDLSGGAGPSLEKVGKTHSKDEIADIIENGQGSGMPPGLISGDDKDTVADWLAEHK